MKFKVTDFPISSVLSARLGIVLERIFKHQFLRFNTGTIRFESFQRFYDQ